MQVEKTKPILGKGKSKKVKGKILQNQESVFIGVNLYHRYPCINVRLLEKTKPICLSANWR
jgi:hypothetical protein